MSRQYQVRTGPIQNDAAPFSIEMVAGQQRPSSPLRFRPQVATTTSFVDVTPFAFEMLVGSLPWSPRLKPRVQIGWSVSQPTHTDAPFSTEMVAGQAPTSPRLFIKPREGWQISQTTPTAAPFSVEMVAGYAPLSPRLFSAKYGWVSPQIDLVPFAFEMLVGYGPWSPRLKPQPQVGWSVSQTTQTDAPFSMEMTAGWAPPQARFPFQAKAGWFVIPIDVQPFAFEAFVGWRPDAPRLFVKPRIGWTDAQPTHVSAPFSTEMVGGVVPPSIRAIFRANDGWRITPFDVAFADEMLLSVLPSRSTVDKRPRLGLQISQTTHDAAPFSVEMLGHVGDRLRRIAKRLGIDLVVTLDTIATAGVVASPHYVIVVRPDGGFILVREDVGTIRVRPDDGTVEP